VFNPPNNDKEKLGPWRRSFIAAHPAFVEPLPNKIMDRAPLKRFLEAKRVYYLID
jgi:hypothetical protein